jgi:hypothetical protein
MPNNAIDDLCDRCATGGITDVVTVLREREEIEALAQACTTRARADREMGKQETAERLIAAVHYLHYLSLPYD